jgi:hypothetical protein
MRRWRDLLPDAPRQATLTADAVTVDGRPSSSSAMRLGRRPRRCAQVPADDAEASARQPNESVVEMSYLELQSIGDARHHQACGDTPTATSSPSCPIRRSRLPDPRRSRRRGRRLVTVAPGGLQAYGGAIAECRQRGLGLQLPRHARGVLRRSYLGRSRRGRGSHGLGTRLRDALEPFANGVYVNALVDDDEAAVRRAYGDAKLKRLSALSAGGIPTTSST